MSSTQTIETETQSPNVFELSDVNPKNAFTPKNSRSKSFSSASKSLHKLDKTQDENTLYRRPEALLKATNNSYPSSTNTLTIPEGSDSDTERNASDDDSYKGYDEDDDDLDYPEGGLQAWTVVFGSFLGMLFNFGVSNSLGAIHPYIRVHQLADQSEIQVSIIFSFFIFFCNMVSGIVGPIYDRYGPRYLLIAGSFLLIFGLMMTSLAHDYYHFFLSFSACCGIGYALLMTPQVAIIGQWFKVKRGTAIGTATVGGSLGGVIFPIMLRKLYVTVGYAWAIRIWAFIGLSLLTASFFLMKTRITKTPTEPSRSNSEKHKFKWSEIVDLKSLKDMRFTWLIIANIFAELAVFNGITYLASYAIAQGFSESTSYALLTILNCTGMVGRWGSGCLADKWGRFNVMIATIVLAFVTVFAIWLPFRNVPAIIVFAALHGLSNGAIFSGTPSCIGQICRTRDYGKRYGTLYFCESFPVFGGFPIAAALIKGNDYTGLIIFTGCLYVITAICLVLSRYCAVGFRLCKW